MSFRQRWKKHSLQDPVRGEFAVTGSYDANRHSTEWRDMLTGVVSAPGVPPTAGEVKSDLSGRFIGKEVLPVLVDRADPTRFVVLWDELERYDDRTVARAEAEHAAEAARAGGERFVKHSEPDTGATSGSARYGSGPTQSMPPRDATPGGFTPGGFTPGGFTPGDATPGAATPQWARDMVADLARQGVLGPHVLDSADVTVITGADAASTVDDGFSARSGDGPGLMSAGTAAQLMATGLPARAALLTVTDVPVPQTALPGPTASLCDLTLRVTLPGRPSYVTTTRLGFRSAERRAAVAVIGANLPVRVNAAEHAHVVVDSAAFDAEHPSF